MSKTTRKISKLTKKSFIVLKNEGALSLGIKTLTKIQKKKMQVSSNPAAKRHFVSLVDRKNVMKADWSTPYQPVKAIGDPLKVVSWVMSPPSGGGGHQNIFRFIEYLDRVGYENHVYIYTTYDDMTITQARENVAKYCRAERLHFHYLKNDIEKSDVVFATGWETAYPVFNLKTQAKKMYFVQDFEPYFYPVGTDYILAENTYRFGFSAVTAGGWLAEKLHKEYGMKTTHYDFGADTSKYSYFNTDDRKEVFFYARPVTERRGFDLGIMALEIFHKKMPDYTIHLAGWDVSEWDIPFEHINHGALTIEELPELYNHCAAALVISLTNMSLLPLELLACGTIPVINDGQNNRLVSDNKYITYSESSPEALAQSMVDVVTIKNLSQYAKKASESVPKDGWTEAGEHFVKVIEEEVSRG